MRLALPDRPTAQEIEAIYAAAERTIDPQVAADAAHFIAARGSLAAARAWINTDAWTATDYVIAALADVHAEAVDPLKRAARMLSEARSLEAAGQWAFEAHVEFDAKALFQRMNGQLELAEAYRRQADAGLRVYLRKEAESVSLRLRAGELMARHGAAADLMGVVSGRAA